MYCTFSLGFLEGFMDDLNWQYVLVQLDLTSYLYRTKQSYLSTEVQELVTTELVSI